MQITEPSVMITDYILGVAMAYYGYLMLKRQIPDYKVRKYFVIFFISLSITAFVGGTFHGFTNIFPELLLGVLWKITLFGAGVTSFSLAMGYSVFSLSDDVYKKVKLVLIAKFIIYSIVCLFTNNFDIVVYDTAPAVFFVVYLQYAGKKEGKIPSMKWQYIALAFALLANVFYQAEIGLHEYFNHNDIGHFLIIGMGYSFYRSMIELP